MSKVNVRYIVNDVDAAMAFYTEMLGFMVDFHPAPGFASLSKGDLQLLLNRPGAGGAGRPGPLTGMRIDRLLRCDRGEPVSLHQQRLLVLDDGDLRAADLVLLQRRRNDTVDESFQAWQRLIDGLGSQRGSERIASLTDRDIAMQPTLQCQPANEYQTFETQLRAPGDDGSGRCGTFDELVDL